MTTPINDLSPEELREIAVSMGWKIERRENTGLIPGQHDWWNSPDGEREGPNPPDYPADANAALTLAHALAKDSWRVTIHTACALWFVCFYLDQEGREEKASAGTFPTALCRAYLAVIRRESKP